MDRANLPRWYDGIIHGHELRKSVKKEVDDYWGSIEPSNPRTGMPRVGVKDRTAGATMEEDVF